MKIPYFVFTSGEEGVSRLDWGVKFSSPGLSSQQDLMARNLEVDKAYRKICQDYSCTPALERPNEEEKPGLLLLPWRGGPKVLVGFIFPYADKNGRPNISLVAAIVSPEQRSSWSFVDFVRELQNQNEVEKIAKRGWGEAGGGERPPYLSLARTLSNSQDPGANPAPEDPVWLQRFIEVGGEKKALRRKPAEAPRPSPAPAPVLSPGNRKKVVVLMTLAGAVFGAVIVIVHTMASRDIPVPVPKPTPPALTVTTAPPIDLGKPAETILEKLQDEIGRDLEQPESIKGFASISLVIGYEDNVFTSVECEEGDKQIYKIKSNIKIKQISKNIMYLSKNNTMKDKIMDTIRNIGDDYEKDSNAIFSIKIAEKDELENLKNALSNMQFKMINDTAKEKKESVTKKLIKILKEQTSSCRCEIRRLDCFFILRRI